jgi:hypothetical protein
VVGAEKAVDEAGDGPGGQADEALENEVEDVVCGARAFWFFGAGRVNFFLFHTVITQQKTRVCLKKRGKNETIFKIFWQPSSRGRKPLTHADQPLTPLTGRGMGNEE